MNGNWSELLATDIAGVNPNEFAIRPPTKGLPFPTNAICASADGRIAVGRAESTFEIYSRAGELMRTIPVQQKGSQCGFGQTLWSWSRSGLDAIEGASVGLHIEPPLLPKYPSKIDVLELGDHSLSLLESTEAVLYVLDQQTGKWQRRPLDAPEFQVFRNLPARGARDHAIRHESEYRRWRLLCHLESHFSQARRKGVTF
jgi:hypothetical protein